LIFGSITEGYLFKGIETFISVKNTEGMQFWVVLEQIGNVFLLFDFLRNFLRHFLRHFYLFVYLFLYLFSNHFLNYFIVCFNALL